MVPDIKTKRLTRKKVEKFAGCYVKHHGGGIYSIGEHEGRCFIYRPGKESLVLGADKVGNYFLAGKLVEGIKPKTFVDKEALFFKPFTKEEAKRIAERLSKHYKNFAVVLHV